MITLPGELYSPVAGTLLRRCSPVIEKGTNERAVVVWAEDKLNKKGHYAVMTYSVADDGDCGTKCAASNFVLDLSEPAGRDRALRWLAAHYGIETGFGAPSWERDYARCGWRLGPTFVFGDTPEDDVSVGCVKRRKYPTEDRMFSDVEDPEEALMIACLFAAGRSL